MLRAEKGSVLKQSHESSGELLANLRGCRVSAPIHGLWGGGCRIVEWIDTTGQISRRVVAEDVTADQVRATIRHHVEGRKHRLIDDDREPRQTLPRR